MKKLRLVYLGNIIEIAEMLWEHPSVELLSWILEKEDLDQFPKHVKPQDLFHVRTIQNDRDLKKVLSPLGPIDLGVVSNFGVILSQSSIAMAHQGFINTHFGLLPENPGRNPIQKALIQKKQITGATLHQITPQVDQGPILDQKTISIAKNESAESLFHRLSRLSKQLIENYLSKLPAAS